MSKQILGQVAEATVYKVKDSVVKHRVPKNYRHPEIDETLRGFRTRREAKVLGKLNAINFPCPKLRMMDDKSMEVHMDFIEGEQVKNILANNLNLSKEIGKKV